MRHTVSGNGYHSMSLTVNGTAMRLYLLFIIYYLLDYRQVDKNRADLPLQGSDSN